MNTFISYILLGLSLAAPIGPINAAQIDRGIRNGFLHSWLIGIGAVVADAIYMLIVYIGVVQYIDTPLIKIFLYLFGCFVLVYSGVESIHGVGKIIFEKQWITESLYKSFVSGFFMSLANPLTILFWIGVYGSVLAKTSSSYGKGLLGLYSAAIIFGILLWDFAMATVASGSKKFLTSSLVVSLSVISGLSLIAFGLSFGYEGFSLLFG